MNQNGNRFAGREDNFDADVLVIGLGPTGAVLTGLLAQRGHRVIVVDKLPDLYPFPRAIGCDHEVMRIMQELGIAERIRPYVAPYRPSEYRGMNGQLIKRLDSASPPFRTGWPPNVVFDQPAFENEVRRRLTEMPRVMILKKAEAIAFGQSDRGVWAEVRDDNGPFRLFAKYLVACDGGSSSVRRSLGIELEDLGFDEPWLVVDLIVSDEKAAQLPQTQVQYCEAARPSTFVFCTGNHRRWEIMLNKGDSLAADRYPESELWPLLRRWINPGEGRIWRAAAYRFHGLIAKTWREGRVFLAGDAAHMTPPFMAQGMCQGIRDAHNLAWKLDRVIRGVSPDRILDSYQDERRQHVTTTTRAAIALGKVVCERDPIRASARDAELLSAQGGDVVTAVRQNMIPDLQDGILDHRSPGAGSLFPQPEVGRIGTVENILLDDLTGSRIRVVTNQHLGTTGASSLERQLDALDGCLISLDCVRPQPASVRALEVSEHAGCLREWMGDVNASFVIVRPDHYVFATATSIEGAMGSLNQLATELHAA